MLPIKVLISIFILEEKYSNYFVSFYAVDINVHDLYANTS